MPQTLKAIYHKGTFILQSPIELPEGIEVELFVQTPHVVSSPIAETEAKKQCLRLLVERMQRNSLPLNAPRYTRDMLHERR